MAERLCQGWPPRVYHTFMVVLPEFNRTSMTVRNYTGRYTQPVYEGNAAYRAKYCINARNAISTVATLGYYFSYVRASLRLSSSRVP